jgi:uncharacterized protein (TIGR02246 family)
VTDDDLVRRLADIEAIKQLKARYFRSIDRKDWNAFGLVFARDAVMEVPEVDVTQHGRDAIVEFVSGALVGAQTVHHGHMPEIEITGDGAARGIWAMFDYVEWPPTAAGERIGLHGYGHYVEVYVREEGVWRIARTRLERLRVDPLGNALPEAPA